MGTARRRWLSGVSKNLMLWWLQGAEMIKLDTIDILSTGQMKDIVKEHY